MADPDSELPSTEELFEEAACGLLVTDADGTIRRVNRTFCRWLGLDRADLVGRRKLQDLLTMGGRIFHQTHWAPLLQIQGSIAEVKLELWHRDGHALPMVLNAIRRTRAAGVLHEVSVVIAQDRHQFERELIRARKHAEELLVNEQRAQKELAVAQDRLRQALESAQDRALFAEQMVGIVSHDLRNPLAAVQMSTNLLARGEVRPEQRRVIERIDRASRRAQRLIADLLDFTQARLGRGLNVTPRPIDLRQTVAGCIEELAAAYPEHHLTHVHEGVGDCVIDPDRLAQLVGNLVSNAFSYGTAGRPVSVTSRVGQDGFAVAVHNEGPPIPAALSERMFEAMTRGTPADTADHGVGLGLFIVRAIARAHHGDVTVSSTTEAGTTFTATFPSEPR
jgi:sigma-B regulation protein RsbU (phosphoserine phosphatase)